MQAAANIEAAAPSRRTEILDGLKITLPFMVGAAPFGVIFGALATSALFASGNSPVWTASTIDSGAAWR